MDYLTYVKQSLTFILELSLSNEVQDCGSTFCIFFLFLKIWLVCRWDYNCCFFTDSLKRHWQLDIITYTGPSGSEIPKRNNADIQTLYYHGKTKEEENAKLNLDFQLVTTWLHENCMLLNPFKCHCICLESKTGKAEFWSCGKIFENSKEESILDVTINNKLTFH